MILVRLRIFDNSPKHLLLTSTIVLKSHYQADFICQYFSAIIHKMFHVLKAKTKN